MAIFSCAVCVKMRSKKAVTPVTCRKNLGIGTPQSLCKLTTIPEGDYLDCSLDTPVQSRGVDTASIRRFNKKSKRCGVVRALTCFRDWYVKTLINAANHGDCSALVMSHGYAGSDHRLHVDCLKSDEFVLAQECYRQQKAKEASRKRYLHGTTDYSQRSPFGNSLPSCQATPQYMLF